jgi:hypothetical protein
MQIELHLADIIHEQTIKADAARLKMKKIERCALKKKIAAHSLQRL